MCPLTLICGSCRTKKAFRCAECGFIESRRNYKKHQHGPKATRWLGRCQWAERCPYVDLREHDSEDPMDPFEITQETRLQVVACCFRHLIKQKKIPYAFSYYAQLAHVLFVVDFNRNPPASETLHSLYCDKDELLKFAEGHVEPLVLPDLWRDWVNVNVNAKTNSREVQTNITIDPDTHNDNVVLEGARILVTQKESFKRSRKRYSQTDITYAVPSLNVKNGKVIRKIVYRFRRTNSKKAEARFKREMDKENREWDKRQQAKRALKKAAKRAACKG